MLQARLQIEASTDIEERGGAHRRACCCSKHSTQHGTHSTGYARQVGEGEPRAGHLVGEAEGRAPFGGEAALLPPRPCSCSIPPTCTHGKSACVRKHVCRNMCAETGSNQHVCRNCFCISMCAETRASGGAHARRTRGRELPPGQPAAGDALLQTTAGMQMQGAVTSSRCPLCACAHAAWGQVGKHRCGLGRRRGECQGFGGILLRLFLLDGLIGKGEGGAELRVAEAAHLRVDAVLSLPAPPHRTSSANTCVSERGSPCV